MFKASKKTLLQVGQKTQRLVQMGITSNTYRWLYTKNDRHSCVKNKEKPVEGSPKPLKGKVKLHSLKLKAIDNVPNLTCWEWKSVRSFFSPSTD